MAETIYDFCIPSVTGAELDFASYQGRPMLLVNTASKCGFTYQYDGLQQLHEQFGPRGLVVIGFPCDQFAHQEPGDDAEIADFCRVNFGVTFPLTTKIDVNGPNTHPIFGFLKGRARGTLTSAVKWNFTKFLVACDGVSVRRFPPKVKPEALAPRIEEWLPA